MTQMLTIFVYPQIIIFGKLGLKGWWWESTIIWLVNYRVSKNEVLFFELILWENQKRWWIICSFLAIVQKLLFYSNNFWSIPVGKIAENAVCRMYFSIFHNMDCILSAELTKNTLLQTVFLAILPTRTTAWKSKHDLPKLTLHLNEEKKRILRNLFWLFHNIRKSTYFRDTWYLTVLEDYIGLGLLLSPPFLDIIVIHECSK